MSIQRFPLSAVQKIRQHIQTALTLPESENRLDRRLPDPDGDFPEPGSLSDLGNLFSVGGVREAIATASATSTSWFLSTTNPGAALLKLPGLSLKPDLRLVAYLYRGAEGGIGRVWALPETMSTTAQLEKALVNCRDRTQIPQPVGVLSDVMGSIAGDRSPASFLIASILRREFSEFGALGNFQEWSHHRLITQPPEQAKWQWRVKQPLDLAPKVRMFPDGKAAVEFFTCRMVTPVTIFQHIDQYPAASYQAIGVDRPVANRQRG